MLKANSDPNDPRSYLYLDQFLDGTLGERLNPIPAKTIGEGLAAAMSVPEGPSRHALLKVVSTALSAHMRRKELYEENAQLHERLKTENPSGASIQRVSAQLKSALGVIRQTFRKAYDMEKARGAEPSKTSFFWFEHELCIHTDYINRLIAELAAVAPVVSGEAGEHGELDES